MVSSPHGHGGGGLNSFLVSSLVNDDDADVVNADADADADDDMNDEDEESEFPNMKYQIPN